MYHEKIVDSYMFWCNWRIRDEGLNKSNERVFVLILVAIIKQEAIYFIKIYWFFALLPFCRIDGWCRLISVEKCINVITTNADMFVNNRLYECVISFLKYKMLIYMYEINCWNTMNIIIQEFVINVKVFDLKLISLE